MYSVDFREAVLKCRASHTQSETSEVFGISVSVIKDWEKLKKEKGSVKPAKLKRSGRKIKKAELEADVKTYPEDFNWERAERFGCSEEGMRKAMKRHKLTRKKKRQNT